MINPFHGPRAASSLAGILAIALVAASEESTGATLIRLEKYDLDKLEVTGFELPRKAKIEIEAVGARPRWSEGFSAYAWILNTATREVVWSQDESGSSRVDDERLLRRTKETLDLEPGRYELYTWAGSSWDLHGIRIHVADGGDWKDSHNNRWNSGNSDRELRGASRECWIELRSNDLTKGDIRAFEPAGDWPGAVYRATKLGDHAFVETGLRIDRPVDLRIYSVCEFPRRWDEVADGGWIVDATTRERVWEFRRRETKPAGGAEKNRLYDDQVHLEPGSYVLYYGTDDTHSWDEWNSSPPYDPMNWGITLLPGKSFDASAVHVNEKYQRGAPLLAMTKARDQEDFEKAFRLAREGEIQILAVGEYDEGNGEFADHGWIVRAGETEPVWEMTRRNTSHGGGATKNRMFDGSVKLPAGNYELYYETDESHSTRDWNADAPYQPDLYGVSIYAGKGLSAADFQVVAKPEKSRGGATGKQLVSLVEIGDHDRARETFTLDRPTKVHIYALGEGDRGQMHDYAYIEDKKSGDVVWEMTYRKTNHAGGARKNRKFDGEVSLDAGTYEVFYESDDSHSYPDWNAARPRDPRHWGVTITLAETK